ncbi:hypothetical protein ACPPVU_09115 [Mucilaginibacter sp. McL0603]|uniref:hypothetical protein n=1 Tax=Mucilaginibacter sp. McL0603 TaxID=3415670 RepID=UPI003CEB9B03
MVKKVITVLMACFILTGSVVLPLGDFSLTRDLPEMYRSYSKITTPEELGVLDFIGDYLLHGKEMFGHNNHDKSQNGSNTVQFQHQPVPFYVVLPPIHLSAITVHMDIVAHPPIGITAHTSEFKNKLFRPPLALA